MNLEEKNAFVQRCLNDLDSLIDRLNMLNAEESILEYALFIENFLENEIQIIEGEKVNVGEEK